MAMKCLRKFKWLKLPRATIFAGKRLMGCCLKRVNMYAVNRSRFTRLVDAITYPGGCYAVYINHRELQKWMEEGENRLL